MLSPIRSAKRHSTTTPRTLCIRGVLLLFVWRVGSGRARDPTRWAHSPKAPDRPYHMGWGREAPALPQTIPYGVEGGGPRPPAPDHVYYVYVVCCCLFGGSGRVARATRPTKQTPPHHIYYVYVVCCCSFVWWVGSGRARDPTHQTKQTATATHPMQSMWCAVALFCVAGRVTPAKIYKSHQDTRDRKGRTLGHDARKGRVRTQQQLLVWWVSRRLLLKCMNSNF